ERGLRPAELWADRGYASAELESKISLRRRSAALRSAADWSGSRFSPTPEKMRGGRETRGYLSAQRDQLRLEPAAPYLDEQHRAGRCAPPLGRAAGIEEPDAVHALGLGDVGVSVDDGVGARKASRQARRASSPWARHVQHPDAHLLDLDDAALGQKPAQFRLVGV